MADASHQISQAASEAIDDRPRPLSFPLEPPPPPRKFGEPRVYRLDGGFKATIEGDADSIEQDFSVSAENDSLQIFTGDAAIRRRMHKQGGATIFPEYQAPPARSLSAAAPAGVGDPVRFPGRAYDGTTPPPRDYQEQVLADVGMDMQSLGREHGL